MTLDQSVLATLAYHDIFDYPMTLIEIHKFLIGERATLKQTEQSTTNLKRTKQIGERQSFLHLKNREKIVTIRLSHKKYSRVKYKKAVFYAKILKLIPTLNLAAISGALSMENSHKNDDIDLVLVTAPNNLWTTRFLANLLLFPFKRKPHQPLTLNPLRPRSEASHSPSTKDRACLNLFIDSQDLEIKQQNLYSAHEICQMKPLWDRNQTYSRFIKANFWISKFLPNWTPDTPFRHSRALPAGRQEGGNQILNGNSGTSRKNDLSLITYHLSLVEILLKKFQFFYMRSKISTERIGDTQLFFHPSNTQKWALDEYHKRLKKLKIGY